MASLGNFNTRDEAIAAWEGAYNAALEELVQEITNEASDAANEAIEEAMNEALAEASAQYQEAWDAWWDAQQEAIDEWVQAYSEAEQKAIEEAIAKALEEGKPWYRMEDLPSIDLPEIDFTAPPQEGDFQVDAEGIFSSVYDSVIDGVNDAAIDQVNSEVDLSDFLDCVDEVEFEYDPNMTQEEIDNVKDTIEDMEDDCFYGALIDLLGGSVNIKVDPNSNSPGGYNATTNTIILQDSNASSNTLGAELMHALQDQLSGGGLGAIQAGGPPYTGGSNYEFEEKLVSLLQPLFQDPPGASPSFPDIHPDTYFFFVDLIEANGGNFPTSFTAEQEATYMSFVEFFQQANQGLPGLYGSPIDPANSFPSTIMAIINAINCD